MSFFSKLLGLKPNDNVTPSGSDGWYKTSLFGKVYVNFHYFRDVKDLNNIVKYDTTSDTLNRVFELYMKYGLPDCQVRSKVPVREVFAYIPANAHPEYAMPINFLITKGNKKLAVLLLSRTKTYRYSYLETKELCKENSIDVMRFYFEYENQEQYVLERIRKALQ